MPNSVLKSTKFDEDNRLGSFIRQRRQDLGLTQADVAASAGIAQGNLSDIERGRTALPTAAVRRAIAHAINVSHLDLLLASGELFEEELGYHSSKSSIPGSLAREWEELGKSLPEDALLVAMMVVRGLHEQLRKYPGLAVVWREK